MLKPLPSSNLLEADCALIKSTDPAGSDEFGNTRSVLLFVAVPIRKKLIGVDMFLLTTPDAVPATLGKVAKPKKSAFKSVPNGRLIGDIILLLFFNVINPIFYRKQAHSPVSIFPGYLYKPPTYNFQPIALLSRLRNTEMVCLYQPVCLCIGRLQPLACMF